MPSDSPKHRSPSTTMTFTCGPIEIDIFLRKMWHPAPGDGWLTFDPDSESWQGKARLPIGKSHVCMDSYDGIILTPFQIYNIIIRVEEGFTGRISIQVGSSMKSRSKTNHLVPYVERDVEGQGLVLDISKEENPRPDFFFQGFGSDQGIYTSPHTPYLLYICSYTATGNTDKDAFGFARVDIKRGTFFIKGGKKVFKAVNDIDSFVDIRLFYGPSAYGPVGEQPAGNCYFITAMKHAN